MVRGRFGLPRPFAVEQEFITYSIDVDTEIKEATASSANGIFINDELKPFFEIHSVDTTEVGGRGVKTNIRIDADDTFIDLSDFRVFTSNLNQVTGELITSGDVLISPSLIANRAFAEVEQDPFLLLKLTSNRVRGDELDEFVQNAEEQGFIVTSVESEITEGEARAYFLAKGVEMELLSEMERDFGGPANKSTANMEISTIAVDLANL